MSNGRATATASAAGGVGFFGLLTLVLLVLKVAGYINISWVWVFLPLFGPFIIMATIIGLVLMVIFVVTLWKERKKKKRK